MHSPLSDQTTDDRRSKRRQIEIRLFGLESDRSRLEREEAALGVTLQGLRQSRRQMDMQVQEAEAKLEKVQGKMLAIEGDIQNEKKAMRLL